MTQNEERLLNALEQVCELISDNDIDEYSEIIKKLSVSESDDPECLRRMLGCMRDTDAGEVQYELVEACERFHINIYVRVFVEESKLVETRSPQWFELLLCSMLNSVSYVDELRQVLLKLAPSKREEFLSIVRKIATLHPKYQPILKYIE